MSKKAFSKIETERLILRRFKKADAVAFLKYRTNPIVALYQGEGWLDYTMEKAEVFVDEMMCAEIDVPGDWFQVAIELKEAGCLIGDCGIHTLGEDSNQIEIGFSLDPEFQGKGYGSEAVRGILNFLFNDLGKHRVIANVDVRNNPSAELLKRVGFRQEGHFIQNAWYKGEYTDEFLFAMLKEEWAKKA